MNSMLVARPLFEVVLLAIVMVVLVAPQYWMKLSLAFFGFRMLTSNFGLRCLKTAPRDLKGIALLLRIRWKIRRALRQNIPVHRHFLAVVNSHPDKECLVEVESGRSFTFLQFNEHANEYANYFKEKYQSGEVVALFLENGIEFFSLWLGLSKIGVVSAWINSNLKREPLAHSIRVSNCVTVITSRNLLPTLLNAVSEGFLPTDLKILLVDNPEGSGASEFESIQPHLGDSREPEAVEGLDFRSTLCYIYTSGTTGNPKAAIIKHYRYFLMGTAASFAFGVRSTDRVYITMPMYHSAAGILGTAHILLRGCTAVIRPKFSASQFWKDCVKYDCTVSQYIGEICRYLLSQKECPEEARHRVRLMFGNGLRPEIWAAFVKRFQIQRIGELYGSTEGNSNMLNLDNHEGSCGFMPIYPFLSKVYPIILLKVDPESGEIIRDSNGLCVRCQPGDTGEMVGAIRNEDPILRFEGYVNTDDTQKKVIRNVVSKGDSVFASGDILHWDELGYLYFKDRRGDTYRWRGENVSTTEVEGVIQPLMDIIDATVFGVQVPGREGRAGMIGAVLAEGTDVDELIRRLSTRLSDHLATYAIPVFLRICKQVDKTGTYKLKKALLQTDGYDVERCGEDTVYYWNSAAKLYTVLSQQMQQDIDSGAFNRI